MSTNKIGYQTHSVSVGLTSTVIIGPNPKRHALILTGVAAQDTSYGFGEDAVLNRGLTFPNATMPMVLKYDDLGDALYQSVRAITEIAPGVVGIVELVRT